MASEQFKPMLSATCEDATQLKFPVLASPKLDGIRCIIRGGVAVSRNLKPIPNQYVQAQLAGLPEGLDGELIVGDATGPDVWNKSQSGVMSADGEPDFTFWVFDWNGDADDGSGRDDDVFGARLHFVSEAVPYHAKQGRPVVVVPHCLMQNAPQLAAYESMQVIAGYEGVMIRDPNGRYKFGRSTVREGGLLKLKRWHDAEALVVDFVERMHNGNAATKDELGRTKRTTHKANKTGRGDLGALVCVFGMVDEAGKTATLSRFEIGTGFTDAQRAEIWNNRASYENAAATFKYQQLSPDGVPRFPVFKGFRNDGTTEERLEP